MDKSWRAEVVGREMDREVLEGTGSKITGLTGNTGELTLPK